MKEWNNLFPNKAAFIVFSLYISLFVFQGVFVTASKSSSGKYEYNTTLVVFLSELLKLIASAILYSYRREVALLWKFILSTCSSRRRKKFYEEYSLAPPNKNKPQLLKAIVINYKLLLLYFVPSLLYCFYNNLAFVNLSHYDPTTYYILLQFRVVLTAILFQCLFKRKLSLIQWISLGILTIGCMIKNFDAAAVQGNDNDDIWSQVFSIYTLSINFQNFCSCLAGTYNEYLLKGSDADIFLQNVFMYIDSIICNFFVLYFKGELGYVFKDFQPLVDVYVILIIINSAVVGIVTSFFLKNLNSILKTYASALELIVTAVVCYLIFGILITWFTILSICLVSIAVAMYFKNPVNNLKTKSHDGVDKKPLLEVVTE